MDTNNFYTFDKGILILQIIGVSGSKKDMIGKVIGERLKVYVKKTPEQGKATKYMMEFLAKEFGISKKDVILISGEFSVKKTIKLLNPKIKPKSLEKYLFF